MLRERILAAALLQEKVCLFKYFTENHKVQLVYLGIGSVIVVYSNQIIERGIATSYRGCRRFQRDQWIT